MYSAELERGATYFHITPTDRSVKFQITGHDQLYNTKRTSGIVRRAIVKNVQSQINRKGKFTDQQFPCPTLPNCRLVRLFDFYKKQVDLFPYDETESSFITPQRQYNSFMAESGIISYFYTKTLFLTQEVNQNGYYQYFVKRNGQYYVEECDDFIPVDKQTWKPLWGLTLDHPWQIMLFKAWLKECKTFQAMHAAQPFSFLQAFGLPQYRVVNFRKQQKFLINEKIGQSQKTQNLKNFTMYDPDITIVARTVPSRSLTELGLVPNSSAYRIQKANMEGSTRLFKVYSSLPCHWVGSHSAVLKTPLNEIYNSKLSLDLERTVLMTQKQVITYFNKFFAAPSLLSQPKKLLIQDCINANVVNSSPVWIKFTATQPGLLAISIEVPKKRVNNVYAEFRYFLSRKNDQQQLSRSHFREDIAGSKLQQNMYITSNCDKWEYFRIDYVQGYQNHTTTFTKVTPGDYVLFVQAEMTGTLRVRFDSHVRMQQPVVYQPTPAQTKQIFDSTFFSISRDAAVQATFNQAVFNQSITLNNSFEELGFGSICIKTLTKAAHKVAMRVYPDKLKGAGLRLLSHYDDIQEDQNKQKNLVLISSKGRPEIVVLQRISDRSRSQIGQKFPPEGTVQFFKVTPNRIVPSTTIIQPSKIK